MVTLDQLRALPAKSVVSVRVRAVKPLRTGDESSPIHVPKDTIGTITIRSRIGFVVRFDNGVGHHVFDYHTDKAEDEIEIIDDRA